MSQGALPVVMPVTYCIDGDDLLVRAWCGPLERAVAQPEVVAFETGGTSADGKWAWEVLVQGRATAEPTREPSEPHAGTSSQLPPPPAGGTVSWALRVAMERVTGWGYGPGTPEGQPEQARQEVAPQQEARLQEAHQGEAHQGEGHPQQALLFKER